MLLLSEFLSLVHMHADAASYSQLLRAAEAKRALIFLFPLGFPDSIQFELDRLDGYPVRAGWVFYPARSWIEGWYTDGRTGYWFVLPARITSAYKHKALFLVQNSAK